jgi:hypothetical protein
MLGQGTRMNPIITEQEAYFIFYAKIFLFVAWLIILPLLAAVVVRFALRWTQTKVSPAFWLGVGGALMVNAVILVYEVYREVIQPPMWLFEEPINVILAGMILMGFLIYVFAGRAVRSVTSWDVILDFAIGYCPIAAVQIYYVLYCPISC